MSLSINDLSTTHMSAELKPEFNTAEWYHSSNSSIYLKFVPHDMTKEDLHAAFEFIGKINRIDIVNSAPNKTTGSTYRMAFIHYDFWYTSGPSIELRNAILYIYPRPLQMYSQIAMRELVITINTRPVPKTNYNLDQLSDMFHRLQEQLTTSLEKQEQQAKEINALKGDIKQIDKIVNRLDEDLEEFAVWSDVICTDIKNIETDMEVFEAERMLARN